MYLNDFVLFYKINYLFSIVILLFDEITDFDENNRFLIYIKRLYYFFFTNIIIYFEYSEINFQLKNI